MPYAPKSATRKTNAESKRYNREQYDKKRPSSNERGYDSAWRKVRLQQLTEFPLCEDHLEKFIFLPAQEVHHLIKVSDNPTLRDIRSNLRSLCKSCHSIRTARGE